MQQFQFMTKEEFSVKLVSSKDGPVGGTETWLGWTRARKLPCYGTMVEKIDKKTTPHLLHILYNRCRVVFLSFFSSVLLEYGSLLVCFHPSLVSVLFTGPSLLEMKFLQQVFLLFSHVHVHVFDLSSIMYVRLTRVCEVIKCVWKFFSIVYQI